LDDSRLSMDLIHYFGRHVTVEKGVSASDTGQFSTGRFRAEKKNEFRAANSFLRSWAFISHAK
ncbi:MAG: hypothetical protein PV344_07245, partial [Anaplasma sp.]|nr:hypothetical protein [Anaplasma sp.]